MSLETKSPWVYELIDNVVKGMNVSVRAEQIDKSQMAHIQNLYLHHDKLEVDTGYTTFLGTVRGVPRAQFQLFSKDGSAENILITDDTFYVESSSEWRYVSDGVDTTVSVAGIATDLTIDVADITGFSDGDFIGIELDTGKQHRTTVNGAPAGSTITFDDALPSGVAIGNTVVKAVDLTGDSDDQISIVVLPAFDQMIFTNGQDNVKVYDGTDVQDVSNLPSGGNTQCKIVSVYENHLLLVHTIEGGTAFPQRVRWSDTADPTEWVTGNAGFNDLYDSEDFCTAAVPLGPYMIIYKERSIVRMEFVGASDKLFNFDTVVSGEGAISLDAVVDVGTEHIFVGNANVYRYKGGFNVDPIGDEIWNRLFGKDKLVDPTNAFKGICLYIEELDEVWYLFKDTTATTYPNNIARMRLDNGGWSFRSLPIEVSGYGFYQTTTTLKWNELVGSWLAQTFKWGGATTQANSPITMLLSSTGANQVYSYDYVQLDDNGTAIEWESETKEFYHPENKLRTNWLDIRAKGPSVDIEYSTDGGNSWNAWATCVMTTSYDEYRHYKQVVGNRIRFRFKGTGPGFGLEWYGFRFMPESIH